MRAIPHTFAAVWQPSRHPFADDHRRLSLHGYQDSFGLRFCNDIHQRPSHKYICVCNFLCGQTVLVPTIGLVWQPVRHPLIGLHQRPFKNATPSTWAANSTHRHSDPMQRQEKLTHTMRDASLVSVTLESPPST
ncbi:hypothetical protein HKD37_02G006177 [Glycine soja]